MPKPTSIYLDYAAATPMDDRVLAAMQPYLKQLFYNPSATYLAARSVAKALQQARGDVAQLLGARPPEIIFTAGGTEANNLAIHGVMRQYPAANVVVSAIEHESVLAPAGRYDCRVAPVDKHGMVDVARLAELIDDQTILVSVMYANNEVGTIQPIKELAQLIKQKRAGRAGDMPLVFHTDAAQAANYLDLQVARLGVDLLTLNGGKMYGAKQSGVLYVRSGIQLQPLVDGGGQERGYRSGTENVAAAIGFATALTIAQAQRHTETKRLQTLQRQFIEGIHVAVPTVLLNGHATKRLPNNVHLTFPGIDNERLLMQLDEHGIMAAAGSACSASSEQPSHVLAALGMSDEYAQSSLRFSMGRQTSESDIAATIAAIARFIA
jgi:cysteine desulfurase